MSDMMHDDIVTCGVSHVELEGACGTRGEPGSWIKKQNPNLFLYSCLHGLQTVACIKNINSFLGDNLVKKIDNVVHLI